MKKHTIDEWTQTTNLFKKKSRITAAGAILKNEIKRSVDRFVVFFYFLNKRLWEWTIDIHRGDRVN